MAREGTLETDPPLRIVEAVEFIHHDGGMEENAGRLPGMLNKADVVICPADCVSHAAYYQVKGFCKRVGKPCLMLESSGLSAFVSALEQVVRLDA